MKKILLLAGISFILMAVLLIFGMSFYPKSFKFMESFICPSGMTIDEETTNRNLSRRNSSINCSNQQGEIVTVTGRLLLISLVPLSIGLLFFLIWTRTIPLPKEKAQLQINVIKIKSDK
jgi:hypothetical protein